MVKNQPTKKSTTITKEANTTTTSNLFDVLSNMPNDEEIMNTSVEVATQAKDLGNFLRVHLPRILKRNK